MGWLFNVQTIRALGITQTIIIIAMITFVGGVRTPLGSLHF